MGINEHISMRNILLMGWTLADVRDQITNDQNLTHTRRRDWLSAIQRVSHALETQPERLPATPHLLSIKLESVHPIKQGIKQKTWRNIKSNLMAAIRCTSSKRPKQKGLSLSIEWDALYQRLPNDRMNYGLSRLIRYCNHQSIVPNTVTNEVIESFMEALRNDTLLSDKQRRDCHVRSTRLWNEAAASIPHWPQNPLTVPDYRKPRTTHPLSDFPLSFQEDVSSYLNWLGDPDLFADDQRPKPLRKKTLELRKKQLQLSASALVSQGTPISSIQYLADLVEIEAMKQILRFYLKNKEKPTSFVQGLAITLISVAKDWSNVDDSTLSNLKKARVKMGTLQGGMTEKNRQTLRQFEHEGNQRRLLSLPEKLLQRVKQQSGHKAALTYQLAVTVELLLNAPIRMENLVALEFDRHLVKTGGPGDPYHLVLPAHETKNGQPMEFGLSQILSSMLADYRARHLCRLGKDPGNFLYPGQKVGHKHTSTLAQQLKGIIYQHTGLTLTPHQFRHLAGKFYLDAMPGQYEVVRQLLGHKNLKTTTQCYASLNSRQAQKLHDNVITATRHRLSLGSKEN